MARLNAKSAVRNGFMLSHRKREWIAGLRWEYLRSNLSSSLRISQVRGTHRITIGRRQKVMVGYVSPGRIRRAIYSLAVAFQFTEGGNAWGIYRLSLEKDLWVFIATSGGQLSVMGDVTGSPSDVEAAAQNFLRFNENDVPNLRCSATTEDAKDVMELVAALSHAQLKRCRLSKRMTPAAVILPTLLMAAAVSSGVYWHDTVEEKALQAAALAAFRARQAMLPQKPVIPAKVPHPWASQPPMSVLLKNCWLTRQPLYASVAGWRFTDGECVAEGIRLRFSATAGSTVEDFSRRTRELLGHAAIFNLQEGGKNGDVFIPFPMAPTGSFVDESVPSADIQLMHFISHLQRRKLDVKFTEIKPPPIVPGKETTMPIQDWREFTFSVSSRLQPEWLLQDYDATGLRLTSVSLTMSPQGQFAYTIRGSIYAQK